MSASEEGARRYYYVKECPLRDECSAAAWKKAAVWGYEAVVCRFQLQEHLQKSGKHRLTEAQATELALSANLEEGEYKEEPARKKQKVEEATAPKPNPDQTGFPPPPPPVPAGIVAAIAGEAAGSTAAVAAASPRTPPMTGGGLFSASSGSRGIFVRKDILDALIDSCGRAAAAARSAQRLSAAAAQSFGDEASIMESVQVRLKTVRDL